MRKWLMRRERKNLKLLLRKQFPINPNSINILWKTFTYYQKENHSHSLFCFDGKAEWGDTVWAILQDNMLLHPVRTYRVSENTGSPGLRHVGEGEKSVFRAIRDTSTNTGFFQLTVDKCDCFEVLENSLRLRRRWNGRLDSGCKVPTKFWQPCVARLSLSWVSDWRTLKNAFCAPSFIYRPVLKMHTFQAARCPLNLKRVGADA